MHDLSLSVCPLRFFRRYSTGEEVGHAIATGFLWKDANQVFLVTNWHNVTGQNPVTGKFLSNFAPNCISLGLKSLLSWEDGQSTIGSMPHEFQIRSENEEPLWIEHPRGREIDCVLLPISFSESNQIANKMANEGDYEQRYKPGVGDDCFVIGYPKGVMGRVETPIWKRASIASEPALDHEHRPMFLIDTATRAGMSGSPVLIRHSGFWSPTGGLTDDSIFGAIETLVGIYSGRTDDDPLGVQIGRVWKISVVDEILGARAKALSLVVVR